VQRNSSEEVLRLVDKLVTEGQNPVHFARQMVRFLRNSLVAKVGGGNSPLLQISSDERSRVARVAELFSEEDLARFLQILLRTHSELGYKQEQRFHLELGLLKMVHAQRLLPIEQLLSGAEIPAGPRPAGAGSVRTSSAEPQRAQSAAPRPVSSPFSADLARKSTPRSEASAAPQSQTSAAAVAPALDVAVNEAGVHEQIITAAETAGYNDLANMLRNGEWTQNGPEIVVQVADAPVLVQMAFRKEAEQVVNSAASAALGRQTRVKVIPAGKGDSRANAPRPVSSGVARSRIVEEPVIRRLQEKFGAEIRSVIDHREKD
jgi:DNA polymerase-3 subunit gamma/tau